MDKRPVAWPLSVMPENPECHCGLRVFFGL